ncbi:hypothetical protein A1O3_01240 [Capronia epimyces CBS 606.96]|uniref:Peptidase S33 tripeptidyl aminopeptidase-like C-terminal domain-containing protein n=1 Tax=Capronia epimyces CBS 606.96 TaxID=1182542 RepID=W9YJF4_9EURO|nr:uncharacterized protein A1O3_01240 [Capronia epimyces CBS 606.96]EXJ92688.1 hypothetical protein A1O3_01240 [Capronia epimyces CBS 606.96]
MYHLRRCILALTLSSYFAVALTLSVLPAQRITPTSVTWNKCLDQTDGLDCGTLEVPIDWDDPYGHTIHLHMSRLRSVKTIPLGTLFFDSGNVDRPGSLQCTDGSTFYYRFSPRLRYNFNIVCLDRRGIGGSNPVNCDAALWNEIGSFFPTDQAGFDTLNSWSLKWADSCYERSGLGIGVTDATTAALDWEAVRIAEGESNGDSMMNMFAQGHATNIATRYAELFPEKVRAMVLDSPIDHSLNQSELLRTVSLANEDAILRFTKWCTRHPQCPWQKRGPLNLLEGLVAALNRRPKHEPLCLPEHRGDFPQAGNCRTKVSGHHIIENMVRRLDDPTDEAYQALAQDLAAALDGFPVNLSTPIAVGSDRHFANTATHCADWGTDVKTFEQHRALQELAHEAAPRTLGSASVMRAISMCMNWPYPARNPPRPVDDSRVRLVRHPTLILASAYNPSAPLSWAQSLHRQIPNSKLITTTGKGNPAHHWSQRAQDIVEEYVVKLNIENVELIP